MNQKLAILGALVAAFTTPALANDNLANDDSVKIGIIDVPFSKLTFKDGNSTIHSLEQSARGDWVGESGFSHGALVASTAVDAIRDSFPQKPVEIFTSNVYSPVENARLMGNRASRGLEDPGKVTFYFNYDQAVKAVEWMSKNHVRVVVMTATGRDEPGMRRVYQRIRDLDMILVASTNNDGNQIVYPAAYPDVISVAGSNSSLPINYGSVVGSYVSCVTDGQARTGNGRNNDKEIGSSFAAGKVGGYVAGKISISPALSLNDTRRWLSTVETKKKFHDRDQNVVDGEAVKLSLTSPAGQVTAALSPASLPAIP